MSTNIQAKANLIWEVATKLVGVYKPHEYGKVILPMTVLKRFDDILKPTKQAVLDKYEEVKNFEVKEAFLTEASGYSFYNTSRYDFEKLLSDPDNIESNFKNYLNGFSDNIIDIMKNFDFNDQVKKLVNNKLLYVVIEEFNTKKAYMGLDEVKTEDMGYIFEELVRKFSESYDEEAGAHFTARDIIYLMTDLLVAEEQNILINENKVKTIYDMAMGTSQMLACMTDRLHQLNKNVKVDCYGQELNPETYAIAKADMLFKGGEADNFKQGDTLDDDKLCVTSFCGKTIKGETKDILPAENNLIVTFKFDNGFFKENKTMMNYMPDYGIYVIEGVLALCLIILIKDKISIHLINKYNPKSENDNLEKINKLKLNPMEISYIVNESISSKDVLSMLYYWQNKNYLTIKKVNRDYEITFNEIFIKGKEYEVKLYNYFYDFAQNRVLYLSCIGTDFYGVFKGTMLKVVHSLMHNKNIFTYKYRQHGMIFRYISLFLISCLLGITTYKFLGTKTSLYEGTFISFVFINLLVKGVFAILEKNIHTPSIIKGINAICAGLSIIILILLLREIPNVMIYNYSRFDLLKILLIIATIMYILILFLSFNEVPLSKNGIELKNNLLTYKSKLRNSKTEYSTEEICYALSLDVEPLIMTNKDLLDNTFMQFSGEKIHINR